MNEQERFASTSVSPSDSSPYVPSSGNMPFAPTILRVGGEQNLPNCSVKNTPDGVKTEGIFPEILNHIAAKEGWKIEYVPCVWNDCLARLNNGDLDLLMNTAFTRERTETYDFNKVTLSRAWGQIVIPGGSRLKINSFLDFEGLRIACVKDDVFFATFKNMISGFGKTPVYIETGSFSEVMKSLESGKADAGIVSNLFVQFHGDYFDVKPTAIIFHPIESRFAATKGNHGPILEKIDENLKILIENKNSVYYTSIDRWMKVRQTNSTPYLGIGILLSFAAITALAFLVALIFRKQLHARTRDLHLEIETRRELELKYRTIFEKSGDGMLLAEHVSGEVIFIDCNETALNMLGYANKKQIIGRTPSDISPKMQPDGRLSAERIAEDNKIAVEKGATTFEWVHLRANGSELFVEVTLVTIPIDDRKIVLTTWRDISERKKAEETLKRSEEKYRGIFENAMEGIFQSTLDGRFVSVNPALAQILGYYSPEELISSISDIAHQLYVNPEEREMYLALLAKQGAATGFETRFYRKDKTTCWVSVSFHKSQTAPNQDDLIEGFLYDISSRKQAEEILEISRRFHGKIIDSIADPLVVKDRQHRFVLVNDALCSFLHRDRIELMGKTDYDLFPTSEADVFREMDERVFSTGEENINQETITDFTGAVHRLETKKTLYTDDNGEQFIVCILRDITKQKLAEQQLNSKRRHLTAMAIELSLAEQRERIRIASELHDQIGQALVLSRIKLAMLDNMQPSDEYEQTRNTACELVDQVIQRVRSLTVQISPPLLVGAGLETTIRHLTKQIQADYGLKVDFVDDLSKKPLTDELRYIVYQSARELLINAVKHAETESATVSVGRDGNMLCLGVEDYGKGLNPGDLAFNASLNCSFGLFNIQQRIECLGGDVMIVSAPDKGTKVTIRLPLNLKQQHE